MFCAPGNWAVVLRCSFAAGPCSAHIAARLLTIASDEVCLDWKLRRTIHVLLQSLGDTTIVACSGVHSTGSITVTAVAAAECAHKLAGVHAHLQLPNG